MESKSKSSSPVDGKFPKDTIPLTCSQALAKWQGLEGSWREIPAACLPACLFLFDNGCEDTFGGKCVCFRKEIFVLVSF